MPAYCRSCPYNKYCKDENISNPTCPMGYSPVGSEARAKLYPDDAEEANQSYKAGILLNIAKSAINKNDYITAIECYEKILVFRPGDPEASFLLKRAQYMAEGKRTSPMKEATSGSDSGETEDGVKPKGPVMIHQEEIKKLRIRPEQRLKVDRNIIGPDTEKVYGVEEDEDEKEMEKVSRDVAIRYKRSIIKERGTLVAVALAISIIIMIVVGLWVFGFL